MEYKNIQEAGGRIQKQWERCPPPRISKRRCKRVKNGGGGVKSVEIGETRVKWQNLPNFGPFQLTWWSGTGGGEIMVGAGANVFS